MESDVTKNLIMKNLFLECEFKLSVFLEIKS